MKTSTTITIMLIMAFAGIIFYTGMSEKKAITEAIQKDTPEAHVSQFIRETLSVENYMMKVPALWTVVKYDGYHVWERRDPITPNIDSIKTIRYKQAVQVSRGIFNIKISYKYP